MRPRLPSILLVAAALVWLALSARVRSQGGQVPLPEGPGRDLVAATCAECHSLNLIRNSWGYSRDGWRALFSSMVALPDIQASVVADYLATNFPERPSTPPAVIIPGPVEVTIREWLLPTLGQRPHDPLAARDGSIWWTGQYADRLGRLDPTTGAAHEYLLERRDSEPHGLVEGVDGHIWYTAIRASRIGRLDSTTGVVREYAMPDPQARGPHTPIFDQRGVLFFTLQSGHVGRVDPATGDVSVARTPTANTYPYGIQVNSKGVPWYVDFNGSRVGSVDPVTLAITEYRLPNPASRPRRIALTPDDAVWYTDYPRGYLGRFDPATGEAREWLSPGGPRSQPYGIAAVGEVLWYSESGVKPNTLVRFDSRSETFQTWAIPSGGGVVRHMMATPDGNLVLACSGVNRVALVEVRSGP
jgi:virginiamycin B lyase